MHLPLQYVLFPFGKAIYYSRAMQRRNTRTTNDGSKSAEWHERATDARWCVEAPYSSRFI